MRESPLLVEGLPTAGLDKFLPVDGAFYLLRRISRFSNEQLDFAKRMLEQAGVAATPGIDFDPVHGREFSASPTRLAADMREAVDRTGGGCIEVEAIPRGRGVLIFVIGRTRFEGLPVSLRHVMHLFASMIQRPAGARCAFCPNQQRNTIHWSRPQGATVRKSASTASEAKKPAGALSLPPQAGDAEYDEKQRS